MIKTQIKCYANNLIVIDSIFLTEPLSVIKQMTYLLFIKGLDEVETNNEQQNKYWE